MTLREFRDYCGFHMFTLTVNSNYSEMPGSKSAEKHRFMDWLPGYVKSTHPSKKKEHAVVVLTRKMKQYLANVASSHLQKKIKLEQDDAKQLN